MGSIAASSRAGTMAVTSGQVPPLAVDPVVLGSRSAVLQNRPWPIAR